MPRSGDLTQLDTLCEDFKASYVTKLPKVDTPELRETLVKQPALHWKYSSIHKHELAQLFSYEIMNDVSNTITVAFKIKNWMVEPTAPTNDVIFCMGYLGMIKPEKQVLYFEKIIPAKYLTELETSTVYFYNICPSGSMISRDGEYRPNLCNWNILYYLIRENNKYSAVFDEIVDYFKETLWQRKFEIIVEYFYPTDKFKSATSIDVEQLCYRFKYYFFAINWFLFFYNFYYNYLSSHINEFYKHLMLSYEAEDIEFFKSLHNKYDKDDTLFENIRHMLCNYQQVFNQDHKLRYVKKKIGQKLIPLNLIEAQNPFSLEYSPWKELFVTRLLSKLVINRVTNGFPIFGRWFLIKNKEGELFDNPSQSDKMKKSRQGLKIAEMLNQAKIFTYDFVRDIDRMITSPVHLELGIVNPIASPTSPPVSPPSSPQASPSSSPPVSPSASPTTGSPVSQPSSRSAIFSKRRSTKKAASKRVSYHQSPAMKKVNRVNLERYLDYNFLQKNQNYISTILLNDFKTLQTKINDSIEFTKESIIMSNVTLALISEYTGRTLYDSIFLTKQSKYFQQFVATIFDNANYQNFTKYMFQLCYNLYCMQEKMGIIHGDLHLNNITLNPMFYSTFFDVKKSAHPKILYLLNERDHYIFEQNNFYDLCIIDFSRCIIHIDKVDEYMALTVPEPFKAKFSKQAFLNKQIDSLMEYLFASKAEFREYGSSIRVTMSYHFNEFFKILGLLDLYNITSRLLSFTKDLPHSFTKKSNQVIELIEKIHKASDYYLNNILVRILERRSYDEITAMEPPLLTIINDVFASRHTSQFSNFDDIVDVYNFGEDLYNDIEHFTKFDNTLHDLPHLPASLKSALKKRYQFIKTAESKSYEVVATIMKRQLEKNV
jgi:hypothetical protein